MSVLNPATFLELVQRTSQECMVDGPGPTTLASASGQTLDFARWVSQSYLELQTKHQDWNWMRVTPGVSFATIAGQMVYTVTEAGIAAGVTDWDRRTFRVYPTGTQASEVFMTYMDYDLWRDTMQWGALRTNQVRPQFFTILPDLSLGLQCPLTGYTITADYYAVPTILEVDSDTTRLPAQYRMVIVGEAMKKYALSESASEVMAQAKLYTDPLMTRLENQRMKEISGAGGLA